VCPSAAGAQARLDFVADERHLLLSTEVAQSVLKLVGRLFVTSFSHDGLDDEGRNGAVVSEQVVSE